MSWPTCVVVAASAPAPTVPTAMPTLAPSLNSSFRTAAMPFSVRITNTMADDCMPICKPMDPAVMR